MTEKSNVNAQISVPETVSRVAGIAFEVSNVFESFNVFGSEPLFCDWSVAF